MPCLDAVHERYDDVLPAGGWLIDRFSKGDLRRVIAAEHTGLLGAGGARSAGGEIQGATAPRVGTRTCSRRHPTLELGVDIGDLSSVLLCSVPPTQASYLQRVGRAGRRDGNALTTTLAEGNSPHDLYFFEDVQEMIAGEVTPPGIFLKAAEVLRRQLAAFCLDDWVTTLTSATALPDKTSPALDAVERADRTRFPYTFTDHVLTNEPRLSQAFLDLLGTDIDDRVRERLTQFLQGTGDEDGLRVRLLKVLEELMEERKLYRKRAEQIKAQIAAVGQRPQDEATKDEIDKLRRERDKVLELAKEINQRDLLNTLTDAGLIPNYAFPEAGIELKSVLWRRKASDDHTPGAYVALPAHPVRAAGQLGALRVRAGEPLLRQPAPRRDRPDQHGAGEARMVAAVPRLPPHGEPPDPRGRPRDLSALRRRDVARSGAAPAAACASARRSPTATTPACGSTTAPTIASRSSTCGSSWRTSRLETSRKPGG